MTVCANRTDDPGFFTPCFRYADGVKHICQCAADVKGEQETAVREVRVPDSARIVVDPNLPPGTAIAGDFSQFQTAEESDL